MDELMTKYLPDLESEVAAVTSSGVHSDDDLWQIVYDLCFDHVNGYEPDVPALKVSETAVRLADHFVG